MRITKIEDKKTVEGDDREFLMEFDQLLGVKSAAQECFDNLYKKEIKEEPAIQIFRNVFLPLAFLVLEEARRLILEKIAEERTEEKIK